jgi:hypothetical protein
LVETAQERNEPIPALVYNAAIWIMMAGEGEDIPVDIAVAENIGQEEEQEERSSFLVVDLFSQYCPPS